MDKLNTAKGITVFSCFVFVAVVASSSKSTLTVVWMVPFDTPTSTTSSYKFNASSSVAALALGLETIKNDSILPDFNLNVTLIDTKCNSKQSLGALVNMLSGQKVDAVIGPPCAHVVQPVGELLSYMNLPLLNWVSTGQTIDDKATLSTYIRTMAPISSLGGIMTRFYYQMGWKRFIVISSDGDDYIACANTIISAIKLLKDINFTVAHHYSEVRINSPTSKVDEMLTSIIHEGRIIILIIPRNELRKYMLRAHMLGMTGGDYQFLFTEATLANREDLRIIRSDTLWKRGDEQDAVARQAFENVLYFLLGHNMTAASEWRDASYDAFNRVFQGRVDVPAPTEPDEFSPYLHDTILLYARLLNTSLSKNLTGSGSSLFRRTANEYYKGLSGDVVMNGNGDRQPTFYVYDLDKNGYFQQVAKFRFTINPETNKKSSINNLTSIRWGNGNTTEAGYTPPDTPPCGLYNKKCPTPTPPLSEPITETDSNEAVIISVSASLLLAIVVLYMVYRWWRAKHDLNNMSWKISPTDLNFSFARKGQANRTVQSRTWTQSSIESLKSSNSATQHGNIWNGALSIQNARHSSTRAQIFTTVAMYRGEIVAVKMSERKKLTLDRAFLLQMKHLVEMKHSNLTNFIGVCTAPEKICSVREYCAKGSIQDVIENDDIRLDTMFKLSIAVDICQGLEYIHKSPIKFHGNMRSSNCMIDRRWVCKLSDHGLQKLNSSKGQTEEILGEHAFYTRFFWTAPEILRKILKNEAHEGSHKADVFALGVIIKEIMCRNQPYSDTNLSPKEIITNVAYPESEDELFRPVISDTELDTDYRRKNMDYLIQRCWAEDVDTRPHVKTVLHNLNRINPYKKSSVVDNMIAMMEKYTNNLEDVVTERTFQLQEEKRKTDALLYRMLPKKVADDLKFFRSVQAEAFDSVTIYFSDIVEFTTLASESTPLEIVALLNALYTLFDDIISHYDVYKVETIGDAYMIVSGLPERNDNLHAREIASVALDILKSVMTFQIPHKTDRKLQIRIGIHTGPAVAGVVGLTMPRYCLFGDTVNTASRMESNGKPLKIHISADTRAAMEAFPNFIMEERGDIPIKGKGLMKTYWLLGMYNSTADFSQASSGFKTLTEPDKTTLEVDVLSQTNYTEAATGGLRAFKLSEGILSMADMAIYKEKGGTVDREGSDKALHLSDKRGKISTTQYIENGLYDLGDEDEYDSEQNSDFEIIFPNEITPSCLNSYDSVSRENSENGQNYETLSLSSREMPNGNYSKSYPTMQNLHDSTTIGDTPSNKRKKVMQESKTFHREVSPQGTKRTIILNQFKKKGSHTINNGKQNGRLPIKPENKYNVPVVILNPNSKVQQHKRMNRTQTNQTELNNTGVSKKSREPVKHKVPIRRMSIDFISASESEDTEL